MEFELMETPLLDIFVVIGFSNEVSAPSGYFMIERINNIALFTKKLIWLSLHICISLYALLENAKFVTSFHPFFLSIQLTDIMNAK